MNDPMQNGPRQEAVHKIQAGRPTQDPTPQLTLEDALRARDAGMQAATYNADVAWRHACDTTIQRLATRGDEFTADDVRAICGVVAHSPNAFGARFSAAAKAGIIRRVGYRKSLRPERAGGVVSVWIGGDA